MIHRIDLINEPPLNGARQQLIWTSLGVILFVAVVVFLRDHKPLRRFTYTIGLSGIVLLLLPLVPGLGTEKFGARIWIEVAGYSFQPAEAAKVLLSIAFAGYLVEKRVVDTVMRHMIVRVDEELAAAERGRAHRKAATTARRVRRGLPPSRPRANASVAPMTMTTDDGMDGGFPRAR